MTDFSGAAGTPRRDTDPVTAEIDVLQTFQLERSSFRGRMVRIGPALDEILTRHAYPEPVQRLLAETIVLATTLAAALKYEGIFTLQTKGDGPVSYTVADVTSVGDLRGYASFSADRLAEQQSHKGFQPDMGSLLGSGYLAFTVDQGEHTERYQGIVELRGETLADAIRHYFRQSEQLATGVKAAVGKDKDGKWVGGAIMLQTLPPEDAATAPEHRASNSEDDWRRSMLLLETLTDAELLDADLPVNQVIFRLFHEEDPHVFTRQALRFGCRCSADRVATVLRSIDRSELDDLRKDGKVEVTCEFCNTVYRFDDADLDKVYAAF
ncbi:Hsp33 family molecular chaperone HslO [Indioceanicola profundi]|uniref:Hsp33 family molecular chaperone HslO n=1 Tax=Indioceanicola profundi TaxID=2220096 RepID=UPI000E6AA1B3|nr:Hsp33 family molecular chaperone HslO [Indioceanicola profundi]